MAIKISTPPFDIFDILPNAALTNETLSCLNSLQYFLSLIQSFEFNILAFAFIDGCLLLSQIQKKMADEDDYDYYEYWRNYYEKQNDFTFEEYDVTTMNPNAFLLVVTLIFILACFFFGVLVFPGSPMHPLYHKLVTFIRSKTGQDTPHGSYLEFVEHVRSDVETANTENEGAGKASFQRSSAETNLSPYLNRNQARFRDPNVKKTEIKVNNKKGQRGKRRFGGGQNSMRQLVAISVTRKKKRQGALGNVKKSQISVQSADKHPDGKLEFDDLTSYFLKTNGRPTTAGSDLTSDGSFGKESFDTNDNVSTTSSSIYSGSTSLRQEFRKIYKLGAPWLLQALVTYGADIFTVMIISHHMGLAYMICFSNVWFIIGIAHVINDAWYDATYQHVNAAVGLETDEGYLMAGRYVRIGMIGNFLLSVPFSILAVYFMPDIMTFFGYKQLVVDMSQSYAAVSVLNNLLGTTSGFVSFVLDIEGHAKFNAIYGFWEAFLSILLTFGFVKACQPSLFILGCFHLIYDIATTGLYFYITYETKGWFDSYAAGMFGSNTSLCFEHIKKMVVMALPLIVDGIIGHTEDIVFTIFAVYQGPAEAATWILLDYVWSFLEIVPETFSEAASSRLLRHLSKGNTEYAQEVAFFSIRTGTLLSIAGSILLWFFGDFFVWCLSLDDILEQMLLEIIPYLAFCQPFVSIGMSAMELNDTLHMYKKTVASMAIATFFVLIPLGALFTYGLHYNVEGLAAAQCMGYTVAGVMNIVIFMNADWQKAVRKTQNISST